jgi:PAS domain S-box-containing protein
MSFANLPIRGKLLAMALGITAVVLLASCAILIAFDLISLRRDLTREFGTLSDVIAANSTAALAFGAHDDAAELLHTLTAERSVVLAALYDPAGHLFAWYSAGEPPPPEIALSSGKTHAFAGHRLETYRSVTQNGKILGTLVVYTDLHWWYLKLWLYIAVAAAVVGLAFVVATVFSTFLRKSITQPIDELAKIAILVSTGKNFSVRARRFGDDELGRLTDAFNHMLQQIQERENALRDSEAERMLALEAAGLGTWRYDPTTQSIERDASLNRLLGLEPVASTTRLHDLLDRVDPEDRSAVEAAFTRAFGERTEFDLEYRLTRPDGSLCWVRDRGRVMVGKPGKAFRIAGAVLDITERKESERQILNLNVDLEKRVVRRTAELEESNRSLEAFAYSVSHDLRAPLRIISGYSEILLEDRGQALPEDHRMCLARIVDGTRKMNRLIDDLLQFSRLAQQPMKREETGLDQVVDDVLLELERETRGRKIEWRRPPLPEIQCDASLMRQVFSNLLSNALKYSRPRNPALIELGHKLSEDHTVVYVRDNGVGFDSTAATRLFGVFQRLHTSQEFEGTGVGLATAARIVQRHGGRIWAESKPNEGATFYFSIPRSVEPLAS